jgi:hypothetical protein
MLAPFRIADGTISAPGLSYLNETNTGLYRSGSGSVWMAVLGVNTVQFSTVGMTIPSGRALTAQGATYLTSTLAVTGATTMASTLAVVGAITATGGVIGNVTGNVTSAGTSTFGEVVITGSLDMTAGSAATITGLSTPTNASDAANKGYVDTQDALKLSLTGGTMSGNIAMGSNLVTGLGTPSAGGDATNKTYVDAQTALKLNLAGGTMSGNIAMGSNSVTGLAAPSAGGDATNKTYVDAQVATRLALAGGTMSGAIAMGTSKITGLGTPTADQDAATKAYVDSIAQGLDVKGSCRAATTANITLSGAQTIDGVAIIAGDRVLVKDQSTAANNGIYVAAASTWSRAADADTWNELVGAFTFVEEGTVNDNSGWVCTSPSGGTLGVTAVTWEQFSGAGQITAGAGLYKSGNTLNVGTASSSRIVVNSDDIDLATTGVTASTYKSLTVDAYGRVTGGTNPTTLAGFGIVDAYTSAQTDTLLSAKLNLSGGTMSGAIAMGANKITGLGTPTATTDAATKTYVDTGLGLKLDLAGGTMSGAIAMGANKITGLGTPTATTDATTKTYVDTADALKLNLTGGTMSGVIAMGANKITGLADPTTAQDAATKNYIDTIFGSTTSAAASATAAAASATAAATSATNAATSATNSATSATNSAASYTTFNNQYLGSKASDPTVNNTGGSLVAGNLYWNSTVSEMRVYNGSAWVAAYIPAAGYLALTGGTMTGAITFAGAQTWPTFNQNTTGTAAGLSATLAVTSGGTGVTTSTGSGSNVLSTSPTLVTPALGTPSSGVVTNLTGTASININGTVGATTANTGAFTTLSASGTISASGLIKFSGYSADVDDFGLYAKSGQGTVLAAASSNTVTTRIGTANITSVSSTGLTLSTTSNTTASIIAGGLNSTNGIIQLGSSGIAYQILGGSYQGNMNLYTGVGGGPIIFTPNNTERARITTGLSVGTTTDPGVGAIYATGNITAYYSSDIKFKENVRDIPDALATVNAIGGKLFDWTDEYIDSKGGADGYFVQKADFGVVAQDVQKVFPIAVRTREDGSLAVDYEKLGALAFAALVELTKRVEALESK